MRKPPSFARLLTLSAILAAAGCATVPDCSESSQFQLGLENRALPAACRSDAPPEAWNLGQMIAERKARIVELRDALEGSVEGQARARMRQELIRAQRELPELEALARLEGWLPPVALPDAP